MGYSKLVSTSLRLDSDLKDALKLLAGDKGYQALIREILWDYVKPRLGGILSDYSWRDIISYTPAISCRSFPCSLSGDLIQKGETFYLCQTTKGFFISLSQNGLDSLLESQGLEPNF